MPDEPAPVDDLRPMEIAEGVVRRPAAAEGHLEEEAAEAQWIRAHRHLLE